MPSRDRDRFVHLHVHGEHSQQDGISRAADLVEAAARDGQPAAALTDHGSIAGTWRFGQAAAAAGIKSILGVEAYLAIGDRRLRGSRMVPKDLLGTDGGSSDTDTADHDTDSGNGADGGGEFKRQAYEHLTVLAATDTGFANLARLSADASRHVFTRPRMDHASLAEHADGLIALTGCVSGPVAGALLRDGTRNADGTVFDGRAAAKQAIIDLRDIFGRERLFVEVMDHGIPAERRVTEQLFDFARRAGLKAVFTNDSHYTRAADAHLHDLWLCIGENSRQGAGKPPFKIADTNRWRFTGTGYHLRSTAEMWALAGGDDRAEQALRNTLLVADMVDPCVLPPSRIRLPRYDRLGGHATSTDLLWSLVRDGAADRWGADWATARPDVVARLDREMGVIDQLGFPDYFLLVREALDAARRAGHRVGPGRGSSAGSAVSYTLRIVDVDPLANGLLFERFLDPTRTEMPDIDSDLDRAGQQWMFRYLADRWGADKVSRIGAPGFTRARSSIKDLARATLPGQSAITVGGQLAAKVPPVPGVSLAGLLDPKNPEGEALRAAVAGDPTHTELVGRAVGVENLVKQSGVHACGVVVSSEPLAPLTPLRQATADDGQPMWVTEWDVHDLSDLGLVKIDFLGLRTLDVISTAADQIRDSLGLDIDPTRLDPDPGNPAAAATWGMIAAGRTAGVFQIESASMAGLCERARPSSVDDLSAILALWRPGPISAGFPDLFAARKTGTEPVDYSIFTTDPVEETVLRVVLDSTYGLIVYQEQIMQIGSLVAGFGPKMTSKLRKAVSKKDAAAMTEIGRLFLDGSQQSVDDRNRPKQVFARSTAKALWAGIQGAGSYAFNRCLTGDTVLQTGSNRQWSVADLYRQLRTIDTPGLRCGRCEARPATVRGLCKGCYAWHEKFHAADKGLTLLAFDHADGRIRPKRVKDVHFNGRRPVSEIVLADGRSVRATGNHRFLTPTGYRHVSDLTVGDRLVVDGGHEPHGYIPDKDRLTSGTRRGVGRVYGLGQENIGWINGGSVAFKDWTRRTRDNAACRRDGPHQGRLERAHLSGDRRDNSDANLEWMCASHHKQHDYGVNGRRRRWERGHVAATSPIVSIRPSGVEDVYDVEMADENHNFTANGIVSHNSHSRAYAELTWQTAWLKANYLPQYSAALLACTDTADKRAAALMDLRSEQVTVLGPSVNKGAVLTSCDRDGVVRLGLSEIAGVGSAGDAIVRERLQGGPFTGLWDLHRRVRVPDGNGSGDTRQLSASKLMALVEAGALDEFGPRMGLVATIHTVKAAAPVSPPDMEWPTLERSARERRVLGISLSVNPLRAARATVATWRTPDLARKPVPVHKVPAADGADTLVLGVLASADTRVSGGRERASIVVEGTRSQLPGMIWPNQLTQITRGRGMPSVGSVVAARGRVRLLDAQRPIDDTPAAATDDPAPAADKRKELTIFDLWQVEVPDDTRPLPPTRTVLSVLTRRPPADRPEAAPDDDHPVRDRTDTAIQAPAPEPDRPQRRLAAVPEPTAGDKPATVQSISSMPMPPSSAEPPLAPTQEGTAAPAPAVPVRDPAASMVGQPVDVLCVCAGEGLPIGDLRIGRLLTSVNLFSDLDGATGSTSVHKMLSALPKWTRSRVLRSADATHRLVIVVVPDTWRPGLIQGVDADRVAAHVQGMKTPSTGSDTTPRSSGSLSVVDIPGAIVDTDTERALAEALTVPARAAGGAA
jgi:DNA-directed DNA polymerase III PolC